MDDAIKFDKEIADKLRTIFNLNSHKAYVKAKDFLKVFPIVSYDEFYKSSEIGNLYAGSYTQLNSNMSYPIKDGKDIMMTIEGLFSSLSFVEKVADEQLFDKVWDQIKILLPLSSLERRVMAREKLTICQNEMETLLSSRFRADREGCKDAIMSFNLIPLIYYYDVSSISELIEKKKLDSLTKLKKPNYLNYLTPKETIDLFHIKKYCVEILSDPYISITDAYNSIKKFTIKKKNDYYKRFADMPINAKGEIANINEAKKEVFRTFQSYTGKINFANEHEKLYYERLKDHLNIGILRPFEEKTMEK